MKLAAESVPSRRAMSAPSVLERAWDDSTLSRVFRGISKSRERTGDDHQDPIRAELFGIERLEQHAETLAAAQPVASQPSSDRRLERRLKDN